MPKPFNRPFAVTYRQRFLKRLTEAAITQIVHLWITTAKTLNSLCINRTTCSNNSVQLKPTVRSALEQRVEQPVAHLVQQLLNKQPQAVYGARTVFEQLFATPYLFKTTHVRSSAWTPGCTSAKPLKHKSFSTLSTIY